ncbi:hypothetical protein E4U42_000147 [Claviceps africana]|uniref:Uncharacterized protein n=1 Tax=Claviceps africana TaxID=83212 RepID=A0A8K0NI07_9HYPO|nr:hypothetical protein E4U42_000147 [Claviceps africana]
MFTSYSDSDEMHVQEVSQDAPKGVNRPSPMPTRSSIDYELRRQYSMRSAQWRASPSDLDTNKEVVASQPMDSGDRSSNQSTRTSTRQVVSPIPTMAALSPTTMWRPDTGHVMPESPGIVSVVGKHTSETFAEDEDANRDRGDAQSMLPSSPNEKRKIMGMKKNLFWAIITALAVVVIIATIAGVLGSLLASKRNTGASSPPVINGTHPTSGTPTHSSAVKSTSATPTPTPTPTTPDADKMEFLHNQTWSRTDMAAFQGFARPNFGGVASRIFVGDGTKDFAVNFPFDVHSFAWVPNFRHCCVNLCHNATETGRTALICGQTPRMEPVTLQAVSRAVMWCDDGQKGGSPKDRGCGPVV